MYEPTVVYCPRKEPHPVRKERSKNSTRCGDITGGASGVILIPNPWLKNRKSSEMLLFVGKSREGYVLGRFSMFCMLSIAFPVWVHDWQKQKVGACFGDGLKFERGAI